MSSPSQSPSPTSASNPASMRQLWVLMATVFVDMIGFLMVLPLLPFYAKQLGATATEVGALVSAFAFAQLVTSPLWGRMSDRYGRRPLILMGLLSSAVAYVLFGLSNSLWLLFASRLVQGAGGATTGVVQAYVADAVEPKERAKALGWLTAATSAGVMIGPLLGSFTTYLGPHAPGFLAAGLCLLNALSAWLWLPEPKRREETGTQPIAGGTAVAKRQPLFQAMSGVLRHPTAPVSALIWIYAIGMMGFMAMNGVLALYLAQVFGVSEKTIGWYYAYVGSVSLVMRGVLLGPAVRRFGEVGVTRLGAVALVLGLVTLPLAPNLPILALTALFVPVGTALLFPATTALVSALAPRSETGQIMGVQQFFGGVARMLGPLWAGFVFQNIGVRYPFWLAAVLMMGVSVLTRRLDDGKKPAAAPMPSPVEPS
jgi:multidrug resistance protein